MEFEDLKQIVVGDPPEPGEGGLPLALFGENCVFRLAVTAALAGADWPWSLRYTGSSTTGLCHAVRSGLGLTVLPRSLLGPGMAVMSMAVGVERSVRLTKQQPKHPLLASREERI